MRIDSGEDAVQLRITALEVLGTPSRAAHVVPASKAAPTRPGDASRSRTGLSR
jgi:hypothetical protein